MLYFRPITYADADFRAFKYISSTSVREGAFCAISAGSTSLNVVAASLFNGTSPATMVLATGSGTVSQFDTKKYFPIFRENPDPETVSGTITDNQFVVGFAMKPGNEFEVHFSATELSTAASFGAVGSKVTLGSTGKLTVSGGRTDTKLIVGECLGTYGAKYIRVRVN